MIRRFIRHPEALMLVALGLAVAGLLLIMTLLAAIVLGWLIPVAA